MIWFFGRCSVTIKMKRSVPNVNVISSIAGRKNADDVSVNIKTISTEDLPKDGVLIKTAYSGINYKDGLAGKAGGNIVREYPLILGIDAAGTVVSSNDPRFAEGDEVIATSYELGVSRHGGLSEYVSVPGDWLVPLPKNLSLQEAMAYGTAGFTAALSVHRLEQNGLSPEKGSVLVTGATGGVGGIAITMLSKRGYNVVASTGNREAADYLKQLGANEVISRKMSMTVNVRRCPSSNGKELSILSAVSSLPRF